MKKKTRDYVEIGTFTVLGNQIRVTDPCYDKGVWCCGVLDNMRPGKYKAYVAYVDDPFWGHRVEMLLIKHASSICQTRAANYVLADEEKIYWGYGWQDTHITVGVDSGQCGFFDETKYQLPSSILTNQSRVNKMTERIEGLLAEHHEEDARIVKEQLQKSIDKMPSDFGDVWYTACCHLTLGDVAAGVIPYGAVSSSGVGDGTYDCFVRRETDGQGFMACLLYM